MNTIKSVYYGWGTLIIAGGGAYFFAKRSINADRAEKAALDRQKRLRHFEMEQNALYGENTTPGAATVAPDERGMGRLSAAGKTAAGHESSNPSVQASSDPAPTRHEPEEPMEKSKYEASAAYRSRKGDRFS